MEDTAFTKALRQDCAQHVGATVRRPVWLEQSERGREEERESREGGNGGVCAGPFP